MFQLEFNENVQDPKASMEDQRFLDIVDAGLHQRPDRHFEMPLPLKQNIQLPNNRAMTMKRLNQLKTKLMRDERFKSDYKTFMEDVMKKGHAEPVPTGELQGPIGRTWYIPHHAVYHPRKPEKIRVVYDCSAAYEGEVLNHWLLQGPDLTNNLAGILCQFREEPVTVTCDIEGMFLQVGVKKEDRDFLRFLWWQD